MHPSCVEILTEVTPAPTSKIIFLYGLLTPLLYSTAKMRMHADTMVKGSCTQKLAKA